MKDFFLVTYTIALATTGVLVIAWSIFIITDTAKENQKQRYFECLERTEKETCDKIFYRVRTSQ